MAASLTITDGNRQPIKADPNGLYSARVLLLNFTTAADGSVSIPLVDSAGNDLNLNAFLLGAQFKLGTATSYNAKLNIGIGTEDVFAGKGQSISATTNTHPGVTLTDGTNNAPVFPPIVGQPTLVIDTGGNAKTGQIQLTLKLIG